jgi:hypothetical protein
VARHENKGLEERNACDNFYDLTRSVDCGSRHVWHIRWIHLHFADLGRLGYFDQLHPEPKDRLLVTEELT